MRECSVCGRKMRAESKFEGACDTCGAPICFYCMMIDKAHHCNKHAPPAPAPQNAGTCAVCGKWPLDAYNSAECSFVGCGERICNDCLGQGARKCPAHAAQQPADTRPANAQVGARSRYCAVCGRAVPEGESSRICAQPECSNVICANCLAIGESFCGEHLRAYGRKPLAPEPQPARRAAEIAVLEPSPRPSAATESGTERRGKKLREAEEERRQQQILDEALAALPDQVPDGVDTVSAVAARAGITNVLSRFRRAMQEARTVTLDSRGPKVRLPGWPRPTVERDGRDDVRILAGQVGQSAYQVDLCPSNATCTYEFAPRRWLGLGRKQKRLVLEVRSLVRPARYLKLGCDWEPWGIEELLPLLETLSERADSGGYFQVVCLYSPTGWSADARQLINGQPASRRLVLPCLKVLLVGPDIDAFITNPEDPRAEELDDVFPLALAEERVSILAEKIRGLMGDRSGIELDEAMEKLDSDKNQTLAAFRLLAHSDKYELISRRRGMPILARRDTV